jgi:hypothetical protein
MGIKTLHGFLLEAQQMSASWGMNTIRETMLVEMDSPLETLADVQFYLPMYDFGVTPEPTFTIGLSHHPHYQYLFLKEAPSVRNHPEGQPFWLVDLVYETPQFLYEPGRPNLKIKETTGTAATAQEVIVYPWDEPVIWNGQGKAVKATVYRDSTGAILQHANYLPLTEGMDVELQLEVHNFTWNVRWTGFDYDTDVAPYIGKINDATCFGLPAKHVYLEQCTATENYRAVTLTVPTGQSSTGSTETHHFITLNATFVLDRRGTTHGYFREANRRVSMHTLQVAAVAVPLLGIINMYLPIPVNDRGDVAQSPWPLDPFGAAIPYANMATADPETDFAHIDPLYPIEADLTAFVNTHSLAIP